MASTSISELLGIPVPVDSHGQSLVHDKTEVLRESWLAELEFKSATRHNLVAKVTDEKGNIPAKRAFGSDDHTYNCHPIMGRTIPRGYSIWEMTDFEGKTHFFPMHGFYKFGSRQSHDEDSGISCQNLLSNDDIKEADRVIITEKANGKMALISMRRWKDEILVGGGSKNQHHLIRLTRWEDDLTELVGRLKRDTFSTQILRTFFQQWEVLSFEQKEKLRDYLLNETGSVTRTLCGEYLDGLHMVPLPSGEKPNVVWFGFVENYGPISELVTLCEDFEVSRARLQEMGLPPVPVEIKSTTEFSLEIQEALRWHQQVEGYVIHWQKKTETGHTTIGMEKFKTWWYVVVRMIREFMKGREALKFGWEVRWFDRLVTRNRSYMKLEPGYVWLWYESGRQFIQWFLDQGYDSSRLMFDHLGEGMGNLWVRCLEDLSRSDDFSDPRLLESMGMEDLNLETKKREVLARHQARMTKMPARGMLVIMQGAPSLGKTTLSHQVARMMEKGHVVPLEQDTYLVKYGQKKAGPMCLEECQRLMKAETPVILLARNNANVSQYQKYLNLASAQQYFVMMLSPNHVNSPYYGLACLQSTMRRKEGSSISHLSHAQQFRIAMSFMGCYQPPPDSSQIHAVHWIEWIQEGLLPEIHPSVVKYFQEWLQEAQHLRNPFDLPEREGAEVIRELRLETAEYAGFRRPLEALARELVFQIQKEQRRGLVVYQPPPPEIMGYGIQLDKSAQGKVLHLIRTHLGEGVANALPKKWAPLQIPFLTRPRWQTQEALRKRLLDRGETPANVRLTGIAYHEPTAQVIINCAVKTHRGESLYDLVDFHTPYLAIAVGTHRPPPMAENHSRVQTMKDRDLFKIFTSQEVKGVLRPFY